MVAAGQVLDESVADRAAMVFVCSVGLRLRLVSQDTTMETY